mmetsp:Transcript_3097/g.6717  ORF Transcript_3097/g.6717 Transcript_3097/m.6717 type:complete len:332 (-) Transcript_3097:85-1080(-)
MKKRRHKTTGRLSKLLVLAGFSIAAFALGRLGGGAGGGDGTGGGDNISGNSDSSLRRTAVSVSVPPVQTAAVPVKTDATATATPAVMPNQDITKCSRPRKDAFGIDLKDIHSINPYDQFAPATYGVKGPDLVGWNLNSQAFDRIMDEVRPKFMIEVGSWKGLSAVYFARKMRDVHGPDPCLQLICVDTWLGTTVAWQSPDMERPMHGNTLYLRNGYPSVYYQFLYNIIDSNVDDIVVPLPLPGVMGAIFLKRFANLKPDTIFIDGCHDKECVTQDMTSWLPVVQVGGILFGDDYDRGSVKEAVTEFCTITNHCQLDESITTSRTWVVRRLA